MVTGKSGQGGLSLQTCMAIWSDEIDSEAVAGIHITDEQLHEIIQPGGMDRVSPEFLAHLSLCPACQKRWLACSSIAAEIPASAKIAIQSRGAADDWFTGGRMEAAQGDDVSLPLLLNSRCGHFRLHVYPDRDAVGCGMVVLEHQRLEGGRDPEGCEVEVRDANGRTILRGTMRSGHIAKQSDILNRIDLQAWVVQVHVVNDNEQH